MQLATNGGDLSKHDLRRSACFLAFGVGWLGAGQYFVFNKVVPRVVPAASGSNLRFPTAVLCGACDWAFHMPFLYLPVFYCVREVATRPELGADAIPSGFERYKANVWDDTLKSALIFGPVQTLNFWIQPPHLRVPTVVTAAVVWNAYLSYSRGDRSREKERGES